MLLLVFSGKWGCKWTRWCEKEAVTIGGKSIKKMAGIDEVWMPKCLVAALYIITICITIELLQGSYLSSNIWFLREIFQFLRVFNQHWEGITSSFNQFKKYSNLWKPANFLRICLEIKWNSMIWTKHLKNTEESVSTTFSQK